MEDPNIESNTVSVKEENKLNKLRSAALASMKNSPLKKIDPTQAASISNKKSFGNIQSAHENNIPGDIEIKFKYKSILNPVDQQGIKSTVLLDIPSQKRINSSIKQAKNHFRALESIKKNNNEFRTSSKNLNTTLSNTGKNDIFNDLPDHQSHGNHMQTNLSSESEPGEISDDSTQSLEDLESENLLSATELANFVPNSNEFICLPSSLIKNDKESRENSILNHKRKTVQSTHLHENYPFKVAKNSPNSNAHRKEVKVPKNNLIIESPKKNVIFISDSSDYDSSVDMDTGFDSDFEDDINGKSKDSPLLDQQPELPSNNAPKILPNTGKNQSSNLNLIIEDSDSNSDILEEFNISLSSKQISSNANLININPYDIIGRSEFIPQGSFLSNLIERKSLSPSLICSESQGDMKAHSQEPTDSVNTHIDQDTQIMQKELTPGSIDDTTLAKNIEVDLKSKERKLAELKLEYEQRLKKLGSKSKLTISSSHHSLETIHAQKPFSHSFHKEIHLKAPSTHSSMQYAAENKSNIDVDSDSNALSILELKLKEQIVKSKTNQRSASSSIDNEPLVGSAIKEPSISQIHPKNDDRTLDENKGLGSISVISNYNNTLLDLTKQKFDIKSQILTLDKKLKEVDSLIDKTKAKLEAVKLHRFASEQNLLKSATVAAEKLREPSDVNKIVLDTKPDNTSAFESHIRKKELSVLEPNKIAISKPQDAVSENTGILPPLNGPFINLNVVIGFAQFIIEELQKQPKNPSNKPLKNSVWLEESLQVGNTVFFSDHKTLYKSTDVFKDFHISVASDKRHSPLKVSAGAKPGYQKYTSPISSNIKSYLLGKNASIDSFPLLLLDENNKLCTFESSGGTCNDDECRSIHFRDFKLSTVDYIIYYLLHCPEFKNPVSSIEYYSKLLFFLNQRFFMKEAIIPSELLESLLLYRKEFYHKNLVMHFTSLEFLKNYRIIKAASKKYNVKPKTEIFETISLILKQRLEVLSTNILSETSFWKTNSFHINAGLIKTSPPITNQSIVNYPLMNKDLCTRIQRLIRERLKKNTLPNLSENTLFTRYWETPQNSAPSLPENENLDSASCTNIIDFLVEKMEKFECNSLGDLKYANQNSEISNRMMLLFSISKDDDLEILELYLESVIHLEVYLKTFNKNKALVAGSFTYHAELEILKIFLASKEFLALISEARKKQLQLQNTQSHYFTLADTLDIRILSVGKKADIDLADAEEGVVQPDYLCIFILLIWMRNICLIRNKVSLIQAIKACPAQDMYDSMIKDKFDYLSLFNTFDAKRMPSIRRLKEALSGKSKESTLSKIAIKARNFVNQTGKLFTNFDLSLDDPAVSSFKVKHLLSFFNDSFGFLFPLHEFLQPLCNTELRKSPHNKILSLDIYSWYFLWQIFFISTLNCSLYGFSVDENFTLGFLNLNLPRLNVDRSIFIFRELETNGFVSKLLRFIRGPLITEYFQHADHSLRVILSSISSTNIFSASSDLWLNLSDKLEYKALGSHLSILLPNFKSKIYQLYFFPFVSTQKIISVLSKEYSANIRNFTKSVYELLYFMSLVFPGNFGILGMLCKAIEQVCGPKIAAQLYEQFTLIFLNAEVDQFYFIKPGLSKGTYSRIVADFKEKEYDVSPSLYKKANWNGIIHVNPNIDLPTQSKKILSTISQYLILERDKFNSLTSLTDTYPEYIRDLHKSAPLWLALSYFVYNVTKDQLGVDSSKCMLDFYECCILYLDNSKISDEEIQDSSYYILWGEYILYSWIANNRMLPKTAISKTMNFFGPSNFKQINSAVCFALTVIQSNGGHVWKFSLSYLMYILNETKLMERDISELCYRWSCTGIGSLADCSLKENKALPQIIFLQKVIKSSVIPLCQVSFETTKLLKMQVYSL
ncbi:hypothetical protein BB560_002452 [Smittium megazygosporum]|uniref:Putative zinc-finger domain-containing protein n=1 Tax=Smittium megazygosporum TaxID=133381 RepID=A0A2T9ZEU4_9FUNG|nr:hypothetical protein BB560_002452 [Smittium megazygosporum]